LVDFVGKQNAKAARHHPNRTVSFKPMNHSFLRSLIFILLAVTCVTEALADEAVSEKILGRWEVPGGKEPMVFAKDGKCEVHFSDGLIKGTYALSAEGKITVTAKTKDVTLTKYFFFEGERLTSGVVYFESGKRYWRKVTK
jgi:hypothetical protein